VLRRRLASSDMGSESFSLAITSDVGDGMKAGQSQATRCTIMTGVCYQNAHCYPATTPW
jgi:hypothetical protein